MMRIVDANGPVDPTLPRGVALGFFDGVHRGHVELLRTFVGACRKRGLLASVLTYERHPNYHLNPDRAAEGYLSALDERLERIAVCGIEETILRTFDAEYAAQSAEAFLDRELAGRLNVRLVAVGPDYRFGAGGRGDSAMLREWAGRHAIELIVVDRLDMAGGKISSTRLRTLIREGEVAAAASLGGVPFSIRGQVIAGRGIGRTIGCPTANVRLEEEKVQPQFGVYLSRTEIDGRTYPSVTNVGVRPTVERQASEPLAESCLLDVDLNLYGKTIRIELLERMRPELRFKTFEAMIRRIARDLADARRRHRQDATCHEILRVGSVPLNLLYTERFNQAHALLVFRLSADTRQSAALALLSRVLTAGCARWPGRQLLARALDACYGADLIIHQERHGDDILVLCQTSAPWRWSDGTRPFADALGLLFDVVYDPWRDSNGRFLDSVVESERRALATEQAARANEPGQAAYDRAMWLYFDGKAAGLPANGRAEDILAVRVADLEEAYQRLTGQADLRVYLGGRIEPPVVELCRDRLERTAARRLPLPGASNVPARDVPAPDDSAWQARAPDAALANAIARKWGTASVSAEVPATRRVDEQRSGQQQRLILLYDGLPAPDSYRTVGVTLLNGMFGGDVHSLLFDHVRENLGLAYQIHSLTRMTAGVLVVLAGVAPESGEKVIDAIVAELETLVGDRYDASLLERSRRLLETKIRSAEDDLAGMLASAAANHLRGRTLSAQDYLDLLSEVTREDLVRLARNLRLALIYTLNDESGKESGKTAGAPDEA